MAPDAIKKAPPLDSANTDRDIRNEIALFQALKPYLGHCLTLNHDLNNPLAGILGYAEFLQSDDNLTADQKNSLNQIITCAERMKKMIETLCEHKIELSERIDLGAITETYVRLSKKLD